MYKLFIASSLAAASATSSNLQLNDLLKNDIAHNHPHEVSTIEKSSKRWLKFPEQKEHHLNSIQNSDYRIKRNQIVRLDNSFWDKYRNALGLREDAVMTEKKSNTIAGITNIVFDQLIDGVRVFGGEYIVTIGTHGGVMRVNGQPLSFVDSVDMGNVEYIETKDAKDKVSSYLADRIDTGSFPAIPSVKVNLNQPMELIWYNSHATRAQEGTITLAFHLSGRIGESVENYVPFDAFVNAVTGEVLHFIEKTESAETSPFSYPINNATIYVYDIYLKDYNDDKTYYYDEDPDRLTNATLVFTTATDDYVYPTDDYEMNELVDNTIYVKQMYYSLSDGEYHTWNLTEGDLNIEYNLSIANAYFDGYWGIHFGNGFDTDDVISHEWSHGYTQTGCGLIYEYESGAMNEAFSDIFGETVDILNHDTTDPTVHRTNWPLTCHQTLNSKYGIPPGNDWGTRWSMGENVTNTWPNNDGSIRDMYKPECFFHPSTTNADYFSCTTYADGGGVHKNSGVLNRLYAVLTDGGEYVNPTNPTGPNLVINALGFTKSTNLFWRAHQQLIPTSQFFDMATTLNEVCTDNVGVELYYPNLFNYSIIIAEEVLTAEDCTNVANAVKGSGMASTADFCPNIDCSPQNEYVCSWAMCPDGNGTFYERYEHFMGANGVGSLTGVCTAENGTSTYARVFTQDAIGIDEYGVDCIQFGYFMMGQTTVTMSVYVDSTGGDPDWESMRLVSEQSVTTINAVGQMQVQTASLDWAAVNFANTSETLVVVLSTPIMSEGFISGGGQPNPDVVGTIGETFVGGDCMEDFTRWSTYATTNNLNNYATNQWYIHVVGSAAPIDDPVISNSNDDDDSLSDGEIAGAVIGTVAGVAIIGGLGYFAYTKFGADSSTKAPLLNAN